jgi:hypothetical protein
MNHPESKSTGDVGVLGRKELKINADSIHQLGKEANELEESLYAGLDLESYTDYPDIEQCLIKLLATPGEYKKIGIGRSTRKDLFRKVREGKKLIIVKDKTTLEKTRAGTHFTLKDETMKKLITYCKNTINKV